MTSETMTRPNQNGGDDAVLRWIGDLDHPFYDDERNRYVWYEAQAIGFQFVGIGSYLAAAIALLIGGADALPYAGAMMAPFIISTLLLKGYVARRGADYWPQSVDFRRSRGLAVIAIMVLLLVGFARAFLAGDNTGSSIAGLLVGGAAAGVALALGASMQKKKQASDLDAADD